MAKKVKETPLMGQYNAIKGKYPDAILLFRVGDFYETFGADAITAANVLGITLTKRGAGSASETELAGFPHHSLDTYMPKLVRAGYRVAICDQLEDPKMTKSIVKRGVTEIVTPGVTHSDKILDHNSNNFLAAVHFDKKEMGVSFVDISTGEFYIAQGSVDYVDKLIQTFKPSEILYLKRKKKEVQTIFGESFYFYPLEDWIFGTDYANETLTNHFGTNSLKGFGVDDLQSGIIAAGVALHYLSDTHHKDLKHITAIKRIEANNYVWLDRFTVRNLELLQPSSYGGRALIDVLDETKSPMGARLMKRWMILPLKEKEKIEERISVVENFIKTPQAKEHLQSEIKSIGDLERLISKVSLGKINPKEVAHLKHCLHAIEQVKITLNTIDNAACQTIADQLNPCVDIRTRIENELQDEPPVAVEKGNVIREGVSSELDELRNIQFSGKDALEGIKQREIERTGIQSLKISFNNVFGYYLEVRNSNKDKVPEEWIRKQTLVNAERYITQELKEYEEKILGAEGKIRVLEQQLYTAIIQGIMAYIETVQLNANLLAQTDCLLSFAHTATKNNYRIPTITDGYELDIKDGRHPVIEQQLENLEDYIPNDLYLSNEDQQIMIITGPNMGGKSSILRQTALITLMAQMGSFVPASAATIGIVDKIFTRVGASDNISSGESTFMVEMNETASIINNLSSRSLILLDEIGRGTSTYDGVSLAWSIVEHLHDTELRPKTLFATHYHELNELENTNDRIHNFNVSVKEVGNKIIFLRKLVQGGSAHSFGIHVAKLAGMPNSIILRSSEILKTLEAQRSNGEDNAEALKDLPDSNFQLNLFQLDDPRISKMVDEIESVDLNTLTPIDALIKISELQKELRN